MRFSKHFPILNWGRGYNSKTFIGDGLAAIIVTIMLIPQSLAYALLAGLPPQIGLYASILPLIAYAIFGSSRTLAVGPVAVISIMTAAAVGKLAVQGSPEYLAIAGLLALISGIMLFVLGLMRAGFVADFISHPVISGFITASGLIIALSQVNHILGIPVQGHNSVELIGSLWSNTGGFNLTTFILGVSVLLFLLISRSGFSKLLQKFGVKMSLADMIGRTAPVLAVIATIGLAACFNLDKSGVKIVGEIPKGLPPLTLPSLEIELWCKLLLASFLIAVIGFVESVSVAQTLAARKRQSIDANQELLGLGAANISAAFSGGFPVTGGFSRSAVNFDAGAQTPAAGIFTALCILLAALFLTPVLYYLPIATLAATIIVAVISLVDLKALKQAWDYSKSDFTAMIGTITVTLIVGIEAGVVTGLFISIFLYLFRTSRPHYAIIGQVPETEHFRNVDRHDVITHPTILSIRIDEALYFANAHRMEGEIYKKAIKSPEVREVILLCSAVNHIDFSALESLVRLNERLSDAGIRFHLSELKGPIMDRLNRSHFMESLSGKVYLSHFKAVQELLQET